MEILILPVVCLIQSLRCYSVAAMLDLKWEDLENPY